MYRPEDVQLSATRLACCTTPSGAVTHEAGIPRLQHSSAQPALPASAEPTSLQQGRAAPHVRQHAAAAQTVDSSLAGREQGHALKNDLQRDVFNRDLGVVHSVADARAMLTVRYPPRGSSKGRPHLVQYELQELGKQLQHAWAVTVHKSQGGEFP
ncbi:hypothetical protein COO60DRAFT_1192292 [Scenedesmus sp. NREL 46B-D3]|nr:hypothetical protein COO60DRAFT_1192292 [Scenedesmus sp. NREL 46B-D3]